MSEDTKADELPSDPAALEAEIVRRREHLAATVDELVHRAKPQTLARESLSGLQSGARAAVLTPEGRPRTTRIAAVAAALVAFVALVLAARRRTGR